MIKLLLFILAIALLFKTPKDLFLLSLVTFNHGIWILITINKGNKDYYEGDNPRKRRHANWQKINANPLWDFLIAVLGFVLAICTVAGFFFIIYLDLKSNA